MLDNKIKIIEERKRDNNIPKATIFMVETNIQLIGHRGESFDAPENTLAAINLAWEKGAKAVEVDIHLTVDSEICVIHDKTTLRTTGKRMVVRRSKMLQLKELDAGIWKGEKWKGERIPTLSEALSTVPDYGKLVIEIKSCKRILRKLKEEVEKSGLRKNQIEIIAFNLSTLVETKKMMPEHKVFWLLESLPILFKKILGIYPKVLIRKIKSNGLDGVSIENGIYVTKRFVTALKQAHIAVNIWTVNNPQRASKLIGYGVDYITTDRPSWMVERLKV